MIRTDSSGACHGCRRARHERRESSAMADICPRSRTRRVSCTSRTSRAWTTAIAPDPQGRRLADLAGIRRNARVFVPTQADIDRYSHIIQAAAKAYGVEASLVHAVISAESGLRPLHAVSRTGAMGPHAAHARIPRARYGVAEHDGSRGGEHPRRRALPPRPAADAFKGRLDLTVAACDAGENAVITRRPSPCRITRKRATTSRRCWASARTSRSAARGVTRTIGHSRRPRGRWLCPTSLQSAAAWIRSSGQPDPRTSCACARAACGRSGTTE